MKIVSWNIGRRSECWKQLLDTGADIALLQEATEPPPEIAERIEVDPAPWCTAGADTARLRPWRTAVAKLTNQVQVTWIDAKPLADAEDCEFAVSRLGTLAAAHVASPGRAPFVCVSMYAPWERPHGSTGSSWNISDASAHRIVSDLSEFIGRQTGHQIVAAGDLNVLHGYGEHGSTYWARRFETVFTRMDALGLRFIGPQAPNGRQADPWPDELPRDSLNVPTYRTNRQTPATATRQLDFVFASDGLGNSLTARALNSPEHWGPSDHCRLEIEIQRVLVRRDVAEEGTDRGQSGVGHGGRDAPAALLAECAGTPTPDWSRLTVSSPA